MVCYPKRKRAQSKCLNFNVLTKMPCNVQPFGQFGSNPDHYKLTYGAVYNILGERSFGLNTGVSYKQLIIVQQVAAQLPR
jgi:hypothetical protein